MSDGPKAADRNRIRRIFQEEGIRQTGICAFAALPQLLECRAKARLPAGAKSVLVCLLPYYLEEFPGRNVARYAVCDDYHKAGYALLERIGGALAAAYSPHAFVPFLDISPLPEVEAARLAGLGVVGRHEMLIAEGYGSHVFIGCIVTDLALPPDSPLEEGCGDCGACLGACPTGAISREGFRKELCRSFLTQRKKDLEPWQAEELRRGGMAWGCDLCLDACPRRGTLPSPLKALCQNPLPVLTAENLEEAMGRKAYGYRGRGVLLRNLELIK